MKELTVSKFQQSAQNYVKGNWLGCTGTTQKPQRSYVCYKTGISGTSVSTMDRKHADQKKEAKKKRPYSKNHEVQVQQKCITPHLDMPNVFKSDVLWSNSQIVVVASSGDVFLTVIEKKGGQKCPN
ncbi:hypothetical protein AMECASPLE_036350 [Ameca splendens]|uniref:Uncharacterized protein n=1 Tax=Ameca splendens TaxID=208324 RepID=A0ABV1AEZ2_9TELE